METLQSLLTIVVEATAVLGFAGIAAHAFFTSHCNWQATYCPRITPFQEEAIAQEPQPIESEVVPAVEAVKEIVKPSSKKAPHQPRLQPISVGAAAVDYAAMSSEQLRKQCALQGVNWRSGWRP
jgi:hypothetical protein